MWNLASVHALRRTIHRNRTLSQPIFILYFSETSASQVRTFPAMRPLTISPSAKGGDLRRVMVSQCHPCLPSPSRRSCLRRFFVVKLNDHLVPLEVLDSTHHGLALAVHPGLGWQNQCKRVLTFFADRRQHRHQTSLLLFTVLFAHFRSFLREEHVVRIDDVILPVLFDFAVLLALSLPHHTNRAPTFEVGVVEVVLLHF